MPKYVIKHESGWYYKLDTHNNEYDNFSTAKKSEATVFQTKQDAQKAIDEHLQEFIQSLLSIEEISPLEQIKIEV